MSVRNPSRNARYQYGHTPQALMLKVWTHDLYALTYEFVIIKFTNSIEDIR